MWTDLLITFRHLVKRARFTLAIVLLVAVVTTGLTCVFAVGHGVIYKSLPYPAEQRLAALTTSFTKVDVNAGWSVAYLETIRRKTRTLDSVVAYRLEDMALADDNGRYAGMAKTIATQPGMFTLLGVKPALGRVFVADDARADAPPRVVIGWDFWQRHYDGSSSVLERSLRIDGRDRRVVGVLPKGFGFPQRDQQIWLPLGFTEDERLPSETDVFAELRAVGRLKPEQSMQDVNGEMMQLMRSDSGLKDATELFGLKLRAQPLRDLWVGEREPSLKLMLMAVLVVLMVAAAGVCNFYLVYLYNRWPNFARRPRQMLCEVALLCTAGGVIGAALVPPGLLLLSHFHLVPGMPQVIGGDWATAVFVLTSVVAMATAMMLSGLAFQRWNAYAVMRLMKNTYAARYGARCVRTALRMGQIMLTLIAFIGVGMLGFGSYSDWLLRHEDIGFERSGLLVGRLRPLYSPQADDLPRQRAALAAWTAEVSSMPEVDAVALANSAPFSEDVFVRPFSPGRVTTLGLRTHPGAYLSHVNAQYFSALGLPMVRGRAFEEEEIREGASVVIIDADVAQRYFSAINPIGKTLSVIEGEDELPIEVKVVGVAAVARQRTLQNADEYPTLYRPQAVPYRVHNSPFDAVEVLVRTHGESAALIYALQDRLAKAAPELRFAQLTTMKQRIADTNQEQFRRNTILQIVGGITALLAGIVLYVLRVYKALLEDYEWLRYTDPGLTLMGRPVEIGLPFMLEYELGKGTTLITLVSVFGLLPLFLLGLVLIFQLYGSGVFAALSLLAALVLFGVFSVLGLVAHWRSSDR